MHFSQGFKTPESFSAADRFRRSMTQTSNAMTTPKPPNSTIELLARTAAAWLAPSMLGQFDHPKRDSPLPPLPRLQQLLQPTPRILVVERAEYPEAVSTPAPLRSEHRDPRAGDQGFLDPPALGWLRFLAHRQLALKLSNAAIKLCIFLR